MDKVVINEEENVGKRAKVVRHCGFSSSSSSSSSHYNNNKPANIESIPVELILQILSYLSQKDLSNMGRVSKYFEGIMQDPVIWRTYEVIIIIYYQSARPIGFRTKFSSTIRSRNTRLTFFLSFFFLLHIWLM